MSTIITWIIKFFFGWTSPILSWAEPSVTGSDGEASGRKISAFVFMILIVTTTSKLLLKEDINIFHIYVLVILVATFLLLQGILTAQNMIDIWRNGKGQGLTEGDDKASVLSPSTRKVEKNKEEIIEPEA